MLSCLWEKLWTNRSRGFFDGKDLYLYLSESSALVINTYHLRCTSQVLSPHLLVRVVVPYLITRLYCYMGKSWINFFVFLLNRRPRTSENLSSTTLRRTVFWHPLLCSLSLRTSVTGLSCTSLTAVGPAMHNSKSVMKMCAEFPVDQNSAIGSNISASATASINTGP